MSKQIKGGWVLLKHLSKCSCGAPNIECPREGHPNSDFWKHERDDGMILFVCSADCPENPVNMKESHSWEKTNLATIIQGGRVYDKMKCTVCGITGKRHGVEQSINRDSKFKPKVYDDCALAVAHLAKRRFKSEYNKHKPL